MTKQKRIAFISDATFNFWKDNKDEFDLFFNPRNKVICYGKINCEKWFDLLKTVKIMDNERYVIIDEKQYSLIWNDIVG